MKRKFTTSEALSEILADSDSENDPFSCDDEVSTSIIIIFLHGIIQHAYSSFGIIIEKK
ncbi:MAG: hypothetical protein V2I33_16915 [Kangiellaceae bacterium]|nr:hypothetical protein [Kangiellaceae bacterium]